MTVGLGLIFMIWMPNTPRNIKWLDERELAQLQYRLELDRSTKDATDEISVGSAFWMAVTDPKTWLLCLVLQMNYVSIEPTLIPGLDADQTDRCLSYQLLPHW